MTPHTAKLAECFLALPDEQLLNLRHHMERGTRVLCGDDFERYVRDDGA